MFKRKYWRWSKCVVNWKVQVLSKQTCDSSGGSSKSEHMEDVLVPSLSAMVPSSKDVLRRILLWTLIWEIRKQILKSWNSYHAHPYHSSNVNAAFKLKFSRLKLTQRISRHIAYCIYRLLLDCWQIMPWLSQPAHRQYQIFINIVTNYVKLY